ncbi:chymotrypsinogen B-like [Paramuricea clavata]|uniref:Chymotrypsinogen B-like n=1 Tax=Paramuricea clavata TaxID=317549 RepID=A0A6S7FSI7_PARCT|nr:chymotrypsinogen B-like [Paramuricea clavata]
MVLTRFIILVFVISVAFAASPEGIKVELRSEGCDDPKLVQVHCGRAYIKVNGRDYARKRRGHNLVILDLQTGRIEHQGVYDTHGSRYQSEQMAKKLNGLVNARQKKVILIAVQDEARSRMTSSLESAIVRVGGRKPVRPAYRGSFALVGYTGTDRPSWIQQVMKPRRMGPSQIMTVISSGPGPVTPRPTPPSPRPTPPSPRPPVGSCGVSGVTGRLIGGTNAAPGAWPWQIALLKSGRFGCGGSLVYPDWVVTAGHCISRSTSTSSYTILLGAHNRNSPQSHEQRIRAKKVIVHPQYGRPTLNNDIALIQLERPATLTSRISTVCLPSHNFDVPLNSECYITGWGKIRHPGSSHHTLQQARLPPVSQEQCKKKLAQSPDGHRLSITEQMLCAGVDDSILSGCHGDSGGPYVCRDSNNRFVLQGAVSWGSPRCASSERYTVFARVAKFRNWIDSEIRRAG